MGIGNSMEFPRCGTIASTTFPRCFAEGSCFPTVRGNIDYVLSACCVPCSSCLRPLSSLEGLLHTVVKHALMWAKFTTIWHQKKNGTTRKLERQTLQDSSCFACLALFFFAPPSFLNFLFVFFHIKFDACHSHKTFSFSPFLFILLVG